MDFITNFPFISIVISLISSAVSAVLKHKAARILSFVSTSVAICLSAATLFLTVSTGKTYTYMMGHFSAPWGNEIRFGQLEAFLAMMFCIVLLLSVRGGMKHLYDDNDEEKLNYYFALINLLQSALLALIYTNDIFTGYVFIEICTLSSAGILMIRQVGRTTVAAVRYMIFNLLGSGLFLIGIILLYDITGHLLMPNMQSAVAQLVTEGQYIVPL
ncbi:MAG: proton-conducting transporter membrane subunit, partial [Clostridia bacterium]